MEGSVMAMGKDAFLPAAFREIKKVGKRLKTLEKTGRIGLL